MLAFCAGIWFLLETKGVVYETMWSIGDSISRGTEWVLLRVTVSSVDVWSFRITTTFQERN